MFFKWKRKYKELKEKYDFIENTMEESFKTTLNDFEERLDKAIEFNKELLKNNDKLQEEYNDLQKKYTELEENKYPTHFVLKETLSRPVILTSQIKVDFREDPECAKEMGTQYAIENIVQRIIKDKLYRCEQKYDHHYNRSTLTYMVTVSDPNP